MVVVVVVEGGDASEDTRTAIEIKTVEGGWLKYSAVMYACMVYVVAH